MMLPTDTLDQQHDFSRSGMSTFPGNDPSVHAFMFDSSEILDEVANYLRGVTEIKGQAIQIRAPLMNEYGIGVVLSILQPRVSRIFGFSNFDEKEIKKMAKEAITHITALLYIKYKKMGVDKGNLGEIINLIDQSFYATLSRSKDGKSMELLQRTIKHEERNVMEKPKSSSGLFSGMNTFGGGK